MFTGAFLRQIDATLREIDERGLTKRERLLQGRQGAHVALPGRPETLNLCANNYLGLAGSEELVRAAHAALDRWGYGLSSVRFICGAQQIHRDLERALSDFLGTEDTILYSSCFDAAGGLFEPLLGAEDAVISDELNHACIIDGIRLCKARRLRYRNNDIADLESKLREAQDARHRLIATDGVFSMDGSIARLPEICDLADRYEAAVMIDDSHAVGFLGPQGKGTHEFHGVQGRVDLITGTLGKALGGASGGYTSGRRPFIDLLRQRSRPYLFSNTLAPVITAVSVDVLELLRGAGELRRILWENTRFFRAALVEAGFDVLPGDHPIIPIMLGDAVLATRMSAGLLERGVYAVAFSYPVVPQGKARIRVQMSAAHTREDLEFALEAFKEAREEVKSR
ncbi:MAG TPA: glycine C-acetyltransferase [Verrucomicrobiales bacterium]|nr:glycine C-acetyltransferase [Verrucomicrobiales bacterium]